MVLRLDLSSEAEAQLRYRAAVAGKDVDRFVLEAVEQKLAETSIPLKPAPQTLSAAEWTASLKAWAASHPHLDYIADDSRESIYAGRGE